MPSFFRKLNTQSVLRLLFIFLGMMNWHLAYAEQSDSLLSKVQEKMAATGEYMDDWLTLTTLRNAGLTGLGATLGAAAVIRNKKAAQTILNGCASATEAFSRPYEVLTRAPRDFVDIANQYRRADWAAKVAAVQKYINDVEKSWGLRLLVRPTSIEDQVKPKPEFLLGLFTDLRDRAKDQNWARRFLHLNYLRPTWWAQNLLVKPVMKGLTKTPYSFTPFRFAFENAIRRPMQNWTFDHWGDFYEPSNLVNKPAGIAVDVMILGAAMAKYHAFMNNAIAQKVENSIDDYGPEYDDLVENDLRFKSIKMMRDQAKKENKPLPLHEVRKAAYVLLKAINGFDTVHALFAKTHPPEETRKMRILFLTTMDPLLVDRISSPITKEMPGFQVPDEAVGPLNPEQIDAILDNEEKLLRRYRIAKAYLMDDEKELAGISTVPEARAEFEDLTEDGFIQYLSKLWQDGHIATRTELVNSVHRYLESKARLENLAIMNITKVRESLDEDGKPIIGADGKPELVPITLEDMQDKIVIDLEKKAQKKQTPDQNASQKMNAIEAPTKAR